MPKTKFKYIFEDSATSIVEGTDYKEATILALANRIRANKPISIMCAWAQGEGVWTKIAQESITIKLA